MNKVIRTDQVAALIKDGATVGASALAMAGWPEEVAIAMEKGFLETSHPRDLTLVHASGNGRVRGSRLGLSGSTGQTRPS